MKTLLFITTLIVSISFFSCGNTENEALIKRVDSLQLVLKKSQINLTKIDTGKIYKCIRHFNESLKYVQDNFKDSASRKQAFVFSDVAESKKSMGKLLRRRVNLINDIEYSSSQLNNLKTDLNNNLISKKQFSTYYHLELKGLKRLLKTATNLAIWNNTAFKRYDLINKKMEAEITKIKQENG